MGQSENNQNGYDIKQAALDRRAQQRLGPLRAITRSIRSFFANICSVSILRSANKRSGPIRVTLYLVALTLWLVLGSLAAMDYMGFVQAGGTEPKKYWTPPLTELVGAFKGTAQAISEGLCLLRQGKPCEYVSNHPGLTIPQLSLTIATVLTLLFSFWTKIGTSVAHFFRDIGTHHVIVTGEGPDAETLARAVAANKELGKRKAVALIRTNASESEVSSFGKDGVALFAGDPTSVSVLKSAGAKRAYRIIAISPSDSENFAVAAALSHARLVRPGALAVRIESAALRNNLPPDGNLGPADAFSIPEIAARLFCVQSPLAQDARQRRAEAIHVAILGWDASASEIAERVFRMMWLPGFKAPRVTVFTKNAEKAREYFHTKFSKAFDVKKESEHFVWSPDIDFKEFDLGEPSISWTRFEAAVAEVEHAITSVVISLPTDEETLNAATAFAAAKPDGGLPIYVRDDARGKLRAVLQAYRGKAVQTFGAKASVVSPTSLADHALDAAAEHVHDKYLEGCVLRDNAPEYRRALTGGLTLSQKLRRLFRQPAADENVATATLEENFSVEFSEAALEKLQKTLSENILIKGGFTPKPDKPAQRFWEHLAHDYIASNRTAADHALLKVQALGTPSNDPKAEKRALFIEKSKVTEEIAEIEHLRWCADRLLSGWQYGKRNDAAKIHPDLVSYDFIKKNRPDEYHNIVEMDRGNWLSASRAASIMIANGYSRIDA